MYIRFYTSICIRISVIILYHIVDCYMNTIGDMQNEMDFFYYCNEFVYNQGYVKVLVYLVLDNIVCLFLINYSKVFVFSYLNMTYYYHCNICEKSMLFKSAKKHVQSRKHQYLVQSYRYVEVFENIDIEDVDYTYNNFIKEINRRFEKYTVQCQFNFHFDNC